MSSVALAKQESVRRQATSRRSLFLKRQMDVAFSIFFLIISSPLIVLSVLLIKLTSAGPVFYCALRAGRRGVLFPCCKLRTMVAGADQLKDQLRSRNERQGPFFKLSDDPRVTSIGRFLRRYSIDELPQLWNVLKGEMSLVGPRPHPADEARRYEHWHLRRLEVTPGLTGLWQVTARRDPSFQRNMDLDVTYIDHWSLALDWQILRRTMWVVLQGSGR